jgi:murein DD-endopeptidase MepM/ murein hydrolase activator NlpD
VVVAVAVSVLGVTLALPGGAGAADPLDDAKARVAAAQQAADEATAGYDEAQSRHAEITLEIAELEAAIETARARAAVLEVAVERRAVTAYKNRGGDSPFAGLGGDEPITAARREKLLGEASAADNAAVDELAEINDDLEERRADLGEQRRDAEDALAAMEAEAQTLQVQLNAAEQAQAQVEEQIRQLEAARQEAERQKAAREEAAREEAERQARERAAQSSSTPSSRDSVPATDVAIVCPILGPVSFIDSWHHPRPQGPHLGVDLMSPRGTPNVAVVSGEATMRGAGGRAGLGVALRGDDGNLYYYFHLDSYEGGSRHVSQGEVIGYVGNTGDASGGPMHTHFEVHPGGGGAVNPYPYVRGVC